MQQDLAQVSPLKLIHDFARQNKILTEYHLEKESGPAHAKLYTIRLRLGEKDYLGEDRSIKLAQRAAAQTALKDQEPSPPKNDCILHTNVSQSATVVLNTWAARHHIPTRYVQLQEPPFLPPSPLSPTFYYRFHIGENLYFDGQGPSGAQARIDCANQAWAFLRENPMSVMVIPSPTASEVPVKSPISLMYERARQLDLPVQMTFDEPFTVTYQIGEQYATTGTGGSKQLAKQMAAEKMLELLPLPTEKSKGKIHGKSSKQHQKFIEQKGLAEYSVSHEINPITRLYQIARARNVQVQFDELEVSPDDKQFHFRVRFGDEQTTDGYGQNKQSAKRTAAENLLSQLNCHSLEPMVQQTSPSSLPPAPSKGLLKREETTGKQHEKKHVHFLVEEETPVDRPSSISIKQQLIKACQKLNIHIDYEDNLISKDLQQCYQSIVSLAIDDRLLAQFRGQGPSLVRAQENASMAAWNNLQQLFNGSIPTPKSTGNTPYRRVEVPVRSNGSAN